MFKVSLLGLKFRFVTYGTQIKFDLFKHKFKVKGKSKLLRTLRMGQVRGYQPL